MNKSIQPIQGPAFNPNIVDVTRWDSQQYGGDKANSEQFCVEIIDQRKTDGQVGIDITPKSGDVDDILGVSLEVSGLQGLECDMPHVLLHVGDEHALSIYKRNDRLILVPRTRGQIRHSAAEGHYVLE